MGDVAGQVVRSGDGKACLWEGLEESRWAGEGGGALSQPPGELEWGGPCELEAGTGSREGSTSIYQGSWKEL